MVEGLIFLKLHLDEKDNSGRSGSGRQKDAIDPKVGFFHLNRLKAIALHLVGLLFNQLEE
jgi:hypothetical protein